MTSFKEQLRQDTENIFFNTEELADETTWNGIPVPVVWQEDGLSQSPEMGVHVAVSICFVPAHLVTKPVPGQVINVEGIERMVKGVSSDHTVHEIEFYRNEI